MPDLTPVPAEHKHRPLPGSTYSESGLPANLNHRGHYPVVAICADEECGMVIRLEHFLMVGEGGEWQSTGRRPGDPG